jgi:hypothetical protein
MSRLSGVRFRGGLVGCLVAGVVFVGGLVPGVAVAGVGWGLSTDTYPTNLVAGVDAAQVVAPEAAEFSLGFEGQSTGLIKVAKEPAETAAALQAALEGLSSVGKGNVRVEVSKEAVGSLVVVFIGALGNEEIASVLEGVGAGVGVLREGDASGTIGVTVMNLGSSGSGGLVTVTDRLPVGLRAKRAGELSILAREQSQGYGVQAQIGGAGVWDCSGNGHEGGSGVDGASVVTCVNGPELPSIEGGGGFPSYPGTGTHVGYPEPPVGILVEAVAGEGTGTNMVSIAGGGAALPASEETQVTVSSLPPRQGLSHADVWVTNENGEPDTQAGSHPYLQELILDLATAINKEGQAEIPGGEVRNLETRLPAGYIGDLGGLPQCSRAQLLAEKCPPESMVGVLRGVDVLEDSVGVHQLFNIKPEHGTPAEIGFNYGGDLAYISFSLASGGDNAIIAHADALPEAEVQQVVVSLWGIPQQASHHPWRAKEEEGCPPGYFEGECAVALNTGFLHPIYTVPTECGVAGPVVFRETSGWQNPEATSTVASTPLEVTGCEALSVEALFGVGLQTSATDTTTGLEATVEPSLGGLEEPLGYAASEIKATTVTLPEGLVVNPGQATGLTACGPAESALTTATEAAEGKENDNAPSCKESSRVATAIVRSPLLDGANQTQLEGDVYVLPSDPPEIKLLLAVTGDGLNLKSVGVAHLNEATGQITTTFENIPQAPFSELKLTFDAGAKAALATPVHCGVYAAGAVFTPWSSPFAPDASATGGFQIHEGPGCENGSSAPIPFAPALAAGTSNDQAGAFTSFTTLLTRGDGQQRLEKFQVKIPAGLSGMITNVTPCEEPAAANGECPASSRIGHVAATAGPGGYPLSIPQPGEPEAPIYLTGPYEGAPFGFSIVTPVIAGPFDLGNITTRASLAIDPHTGQATVTTSQIPRIFKGVPTDLRSLEAVIERPQFLFNPTSCQPQTITGTAWGTAPPGSTPPEQAQEPGKTAGLSYPFSTGSCRTLAYTPTIKVTTQGQASKKGGASLTFKISYPKGAVGAQAWFKSTKFVLPKQLPTRASTLEQACDSSIFTTNRAACPIHSIVGHAVVHTPQLPVPAEGPVYLVSYKNLKFPEVVMVLTGDNVTLELEGETLIHNGITSATFRNIPDLPFNSIEVNLPTGPYSEFSPYLPTKDHDNYCTTKLTMPTALTAQNGLEIHQNTTITPTGCPKHHTTKTKHGSKKK